MWFFIKILISAVIIAGISSLADKKPVLAGFIMALPLGSMLSIAFVYFQCREMEKVNQFAVSIAIAFPLSLFFFVPFILNKWLRLDFSLSYLLGFISLFLAYLVLSFIFKTEIFR